MLDKYSLQIIKPPLNWIVKKLARLNLKPYQITLGGFGLGMLGVVLIIYEQYLGALCLILLNRIADGLDGALARYKSEESAAGAFLDIVLDFIFYQAVIVGFALVSPNNVTVSLLLMLSFVGTGCSFLAFAIYAEKFKIKNINFPQKGFHYMNGFAEGTETILFFALICLFPYYYVPLAFGFMVICIATTIVRIWFGYHTLNSFSE
jgi:phosphatidylglycerophosphate synthase